MSGIYYEHVYLAIEKVIKLKVETLHVRLNLRKKINLINSSFNSAAINELTSYYIG